jgi:hypothetical protein
MSFCLSFWIAILLVQQSHGCGSVRVAAYNVWNAQDSEATMMKWFRRKEIIAQNVKQMQPDVIGFEEIRRKIDPDSKSSVYAPDQLQDLQELLPEYKVAFHPVISSLVLS